VTTAVRDVEVFSFRPEQLTGIWCDERPDGSGDLIFELYRPVFGHDGDSWTYRRGFLDIGNVRQIEALVRRALLNDAPAAGRTVRSGGRSSR
jgi:hypothetical protein